VVPRFFAREPRLNFEQRIALLLGVDRYRTAAGLSVLGRLAGRVQRFVGGSPTFTSHSGLVSHNSCARHQLKNTLMRYLYALCAVGFAANAYRNSRQYFGLT
jgi:hypothetical protein